MPPDKLKELLRSWGSNEKMSLKRLRCKLLALFCFIGLIRVSAANLPTLSEIRIEKRGGRKVMRLPIYGFKNDYNHEGIIVEVFECKAKKFCPIAAFETYIERTKHQRSSMEGKIGVFISLSAPYHNISFKRCAAILRWCSEKAGLDPKVFTAKTYRKGGVNTALQKGIEPDAIMRLGNWKNDDVFWQHYVLRTIPPQFTDIIFDVEKENSDVEESEDESDDGEKEKEKD